MKKSKSRKTTRKVQPHKLANDMLHHTLDIDRSYAMAFILAIGLIALSFVYSMIR